MKYYIQYPEQEKDEVDYRKSVVADAGIKTIYLQPAWQKLMMVLDLMGVDEFKANVCNPDEIIIFSEKGEEWDIDGFVDMLYSKYDYVKVDY